MRRIPSLALVALIVMVSPGPGHANPGDLDPTFGTGGVVTTTISGGSSAAALALQADGKLVAAGQSGGTSGQVTVARYETNGALDATFGNGGIVTTPIQSQSSATGVAVQSDGKIVVAGSTSDGTNSAFAVVRYESDGSLDGGFGTGGIVVTTIGTTAQGEAMALQSDDKIVVVGTTGPSGASDFALARYAIDGSLDSTFGSGGIVTTSIGSNDAAHAVALQADGNIVAAGTDSAHMAVARYDTNGVLDPTFGTGGIATTTFGGSSAFAYGITVQPDGKLVAVGAAVNPGEAVVLARYQTDGSLDGAFGSGGTIYLNPGPTAAAGLFAVRYQAPSWLVAAGGFATVTSIHPLTVQSDFLLMRFAVADGAIDFTSIHDRTSSDSLSDVVVQPDTRVVGAGATGGQLALVRYLTTTCGDGVQEGPELCDDGNLTDGDGCDSNCTPTGCGNGIVTTGETCDDGNTQSGDCCSATCQIETSGNACPDDGNPCTDDLCNASAQCTHPPNTLPCDDGDLCTTGDVCSGGQCTSTPVACAACEGCDAGTGNCVAMPTPVCKAPLVPGKASLQLRDAADDAKDGLTWQWARGPAVPVASFGFPGAYTLCVYSGGQTPALLGRASSRAGQCGTKACWKSSSNGWNYKDPELTPDGIASISLRAGDALKGKLKVKGKGTNLPLPALPLSLPVRVQLHASTGSCWEATYSAAGVQKNDAERFKGKSD